MRIQILILGFKGLKGCPSYRESIKGSKERRGPTLDVCFTEMYIL